MLKLHAVFFDIASVRLLDANLQTLPLRAKSLRVLAALAERPNRLVTKDALIAQVWGRVVVSDESLVKCIRDIRIAIGDQDQTVLETVRGLGHRLNVALPAAPLAVAPAAPAPAQERSPDLGLWVRPMRPDPLDLALFRSLVDDFTAALASTRFMRVAPSSAVAPRQAARYHTILSVATAEAAPSWRVEVVDQDQSRLAWVETGRFASDLDAAQLRDWVAIASGRLVMGVQAYQRLSGSDTRLAEEFSVNDLCDRLNALAHAYAPASMRESLRLCELAKRKFPTDPWAWRAIQTPYLLDLEHRVSGTWNTARVPELIEWIHYAIALDPRNAHSHGALARALCELGQFDEAASIVEHARSLAPLHANILHYFSLVNFHCGNPDAAEAAGRQALQMAPDRPDYLVGFLGRLLWLYRQDPAAQSLLAEGLARKPGRNQDRMVLLVLHHEQGRVDSAAAEAAELRRRAPHFDASYFGLRFGRMAEIRARCLAAFSAYGLT